MHVTANVRTSHSYAHILDLGDWQLIAALIAALPPTVAYWRLATRTSGWGLAEGRKSPLALEHRPPPPPQNCAPAYVAGALRRAVRLVASEQRALAAEARSLRRFVTADILSPAKVVEALTDAGRDADLDNAVIAGALRTGGAA